MASMSPRKRLQAEATCPSCVEYFIDPMILECGHNLCFTCISRVWRDTEVVANCPKCNAAVQRKNFKPNIQLANMVEIAKELSGQLKPEKGECCRKHQEPLKLFCMDDQNPICLVCDKSQQHREHHVVPVEEAAQEYKLWKCLETLREERDKILAEKTLTEKDSQDYLKQTKAEKVKIVLEVQNLHLFLEGQEKNLLSQMEEMEEEIAKGRDECMASLSRELSSFETLVQEMEIKQQQGLADEARQDIANALERCQKRRMENPVPFSLELKWGILDLCDITPYLKGVLKQLKADLLDGIRLQKASIHFDPLTTGPWLFLSSDCKTVAEEDRLLPLPDNPERFDTSSFVLGREGFTTGRRFWEVHVGTTGRWAVGIAKESVKRKGQVACNPTEGIWEMGLSDGVYRTFNPPSDPILCLSEVPSKIYVVLNYEGKRVAFYDGDRASLICAFTELAFNGERVRPWFYVSKKAHLTLGV